MSLGYSSISRAVVCVVVAGVLVVFGSAIVRPATAEDPLNVDRNSFPLKTTPAVYVAQSALKAIHHGNEVIKIDFSVQRDAEFVAMTKLSYAKLHHQGCGIHLQLFSRESGEMKDNLRVLDSRDLKQPGFDGGDTPQKTTTFTVRGRLVDNADAEGQSLEVVLQLLGPQTTATSTSKFAVGEGKSISDVLAFDHKSALHKPGKPIVLGIITGKDGKKQRIILHVTERTAEEPKEAAQ